MAWSKSIINKIVDVLLCSAADAMLGNQIIVDGEQTLECLDLGLYGGADMLVGQAGGTVDCSGRVQAWQRKLGAGHGADDPRG